MNPKYQETIDACLREVAHRYEWLARDLSIQAQIDGRDRMTVEELRQGPLGQNLTLLANAAEGETATDKGEIYEALQHVYETLFCPLYLNAYTIPEGFHSTPLGEMLQAARGRTFSALELYSVAEVAHETGLNQIYLYQLISRNKLSAVEVGGKKMIEPREVERLKRERGKQERGND